MVQPWLLFSHNSTGKSPGKQLMKHILVAVVLSALVACTTIRPGPDAFVSAEAAIAMAVAAGGDEFAPVEMRFAREKLEIARQGMDKQKYEAALYLVEQSEINSELAVEKSRAAKSRRRVNELRKSKDELESRLRETFGDEFE
jgi:Domain of unknown function (DUF4398)